LAVKWRLSKGPPTPYYKYEPQIVLENSYYKLHYDRSTTTTRTVPNDRLDTVTLDTTIKEAYLIDVAIPNSHNLHSTIAKKFQKYTALKEGLIILISGFRRNVYEICGLLGYYVA
jgi:hypothetical protein